MKLFCTKLTSAFLLNMTVIIPTLSHAEIHFSQATGMLANTRDDKKEFSPFWAMVALHGKMLETMRFFGNYATVSNSGAGEDDVENTRTADKGKDVIAILLKRLFNSPDGIQFVATTYEGDPVGDLSRHLEKINDIIEILAPLPPADKSSSSEEDKIENDNKVDQIKQLLQKQKAKEEEVKLVLSGIKKEQINKSMSEDEQKDILARNKKRDEQIKQLKNELKQFVEGIKAQTTAIKASMQKQQERPVKKNLAESIAQVLNRGAAPADNKMQGKNLEFAHQLVAAFQAQEELANPSKPDQYLYPKNIVIISLLAFFVKVADDKSEVMEKLPYLMKQEGIVDHPAFDMESYFRLKKDINFPVLLKNPELAFLAAQGYDAYENPYMHPINYLGRTPYSREVFPDCGETSLRNVLAIFLSAFKGGLILPEVIEELTKKLQQDNPGLILDETSPFVQMTTFFQQPSYLQKSATIDIHRQWAGIVSNLNGGKAPATLNDIRYGRQLDNSGINVYEIKSNFDPEVKGIVNMFNVIAKLIPDAILNEAWSHNQDERFAQVAKKLDRFCELLSREGVYLSWENRGTKDQSIADEFVDIVFNNNRVPVFNWQFVRGHFQLVPFKESGSDWRLAYQTESEDLFENEWMAGLYLKLNEDKFIENESYGTKYPLSLVFSPALRALDGAMNALSFALYRDKAAFSPLLSRWIDKAIPLNDPHSLGKITLLLLPKEDHPAIKEILEREKYQPIQKNIGPFKDSPLQYAANMGLNAALIMISKKFPEHTSLDLTRNGKITNSALAHLKNLTSLNLTENEIITNETVLQLSTLKDLNLSRNIKIWKETLSQLSNLTSLNLYGNHFITDRVISQLTNLKSLNLGANDKITDKGILGLRNLSDLSLNYNNKITDKGLSQLTNLITLDLSSNEKITDTGISKLSNLTSLNLDYNSKITDNGLSQLTNLTNLILGSNDLISGDGTSQLRKLVSLGLSFNEKITDKDISHLTNLHSLDLTYNKIITDAGLRTLVNLNELNLDRNDNITNVGLALLKKLTTLNMKRNEVITDEGLAQLPNLTTLILTDTDRTNVDYKLTGAGLQAHPNFKMLKIIFE